MGIRWTLGHRRRCAAMLGAVLFAGQGQARDLPPGLAFHGPPGVTGLIYLPDPLAAPSPWPAALLVHDLFGLDTRALPTIAQLGAGGILALEVETDANPLDGVPPPQREARVAARHVAEAADMLAGDPRVDPARIGAVGFGTGARAVALAHRVRPFAAVVLLYPGCGGLLETLRDTDAETGRRWPVGSPVLLLHGADDPANAEGDCRALAAELGGANLHRHRSYRGATYAWDLPQTGGGGTTLQPSPDGRGTVPARYWPELAQFSAAQVTEFLFRVLVAGPR